MENSVRDVLTYFPTQIQYKLQNLDNKLDRLEEIRLRTNRNILLKIGQEEERINYIVSTEEVLEILQRICDNSIYTYQSQICNGYITIKGGHRVRNYW